MQYPIEVIGYMLMGVLVLMSIIRTILFCRMDAKGFKAVLVTKIKEYREEESIYNIIRDRDYTNAKANAKKYVYFCVCFGIIYTDRNDTGGLQHEGKPIFRIFRR